ncbi:hypothetical protein, conserved [Eimeria necatrix]|uniref:Peptidase A2 domain-containing protein n=1 Tax=Eimeria necatrix TaxID=51315 RepID=U6MUF8_9EIME|nr:hypothetical protein, conserved [Eimeria necatrix]CDJ67621.1 hypothetical protein, conserved [Eimeria necatrix]
MSQSELLTELAKVRWNGNLKEYTDRFATVAERGMSPTPAELADYYCTGLPTDLHLSISNDGQVKYLTWEQAAIAATRLYEPKQSVLELRERNSRAIRAALQANGPRGLQEIENRSGGTRGNCFECPNAIPVSLERRNQLLSTAEGTNTSEEHEEETRPLSEMRWKSGPTSILSAETPDATTDSRRKSAEATKEGHGSDVTEILPHWWRETYMKESYEQGGALCCVGATAVLRVELAGSPSEEVALFLRPPPRRCKSHAKTKAKVRITSLSLQAAADFRAEATKEGHGSDVTEILPHWWRQTYMKESYDQGGALCCAGATAVLRVELAGSPCEALLDTGASRSFISPKIVERQQQKVRRLPKEHRFTVATGAQLRIARVVTGLTLWCGHARFSGDSLVGPVPYDVVLGLDWLTEHKVAWYFQSDKFRTYVNGQWCELPVVRTGEATLQHDSAP